MAGSVMKKMAFYLGLTDDDFDEQDDVYESDVGASPMSNEVLASDVIRPISSSDGRADRQSYSSYADEHSASSKADSKRSEHRFGSGSKQPTMLRPVAVDTAITEFLVVRPMSYADSKDIADHVMRRQPVIINLQSPEQDIRRRVIDFCSGVTYAIGGHLDKVADQVLLLTPSNVKVTAAERERIREEHEATEE